MTMFVSGRPPQRSLSTKLPLQHQWLVGLLVLSAGRHRDRENL
jgi:hypothetical protein